MKIDVLFASIPVADLEAATAWYEAFFGRPADIVPNADEVMWKATDTAWIYVIRDPDRSGRGVVTIAVENLEDAIAGLAKRGVAAGPIAAVGTAARKAMVRDLAGNALAIIEVSGS